MEIFLVRHGETGGNVAKRHQSDATRLTDRGLEQIKEAGTILKALHPTHLLCSSVVRAVESAERIGEALDMIPETNPVFAELERPPFLQGHFHKSLVSMWFYARWYLGFTKTAEGGETYAQLRQRVAQAQAVLATYPEDARIVVVSHSVFINFFVAHACHKRALNPFAAGIRFIKVLTIKNGSITRVTYTPPTDTAVCVWKVEN